MPMETKLKLSADENLFLRNSTFSTLSFYTLDRSILQLFWKAIQQYFVEHAERYKARKTLRSFTAFKHGDPCLAFGHRRVRTNE